MGNTKSQNFEQVVVDPWWNNNKQTSTKQEETKETSTSLKSLDIQEEISDIRKRRVKIIAEKKKEMDDLRQRLEEKTLENEELRRLLKDQNGEIVLIKVDSNQQTDPFEIPGPSNDLQLENEELKTKIEEIRLELENSRMEVAAFGNERKEYSTHVIALKDIITVSKQLLLLRDNQIKELSQKIDEIQASLAEKELTAFSDELRQEYEKQLKNMKQLRILYDERQRLDKAERNTIKNNLEEAKRSLDYRETRNSELQARIDELETDNSEKYDNITSLQSQLGLSKAECRDLKTELSVINQLFSQILVGFNNGQEVNLDKLIKLLEENHDLLTDIFVNEDCHEVSSTLPKVLLDLINQVDAKTSQLSDEIREEQQEEISEPQPSISPNTLSTPSEIVQNLPKVWRVLTELLSHQSTPISVLDNEDQSDSNPCYKSVQTPTGPTLVLSVSKTFIRLKDLIVEKKSLEKETMRLKQLNTHLETRLQDQEKRLELVSTELSKTWNVVGKMQKQHQQLHTQEKILRYELAQKRKLLNELKEELEYCREKWLQAREKNSHTEEQWKQLRNEFIARKSVLSEELNNSAESGYSDDRDSSSSDEDDAHGKIGTETSNLVKMDSIAELNESENVQPILEVIQEEIANIESGVTSPEDESLETSNEELASVLDQNPTEISNESSIGEVCDDVEATSSVDGGLSLKDMQEMRKTQDEMLLAKDNRLKRLEEEAKGLVNQTTKTSNRSVKICSKLDTLHEQYGKNDAEIRRQNIDDMYKKLEEDIVQTIIKTQNGDLSMKQSNELELYDDGAQASTSSAKTSAEIFAKREERLQRMEVQAQQLVMRVQNNSVKSSEICSKLNLLHERCVESISSQNLTGEDVEIDEEEDTKTES